MGKAKAEPFIKQTNRFAALADSDSDDDTNDLGMQAVASPKTVEALAPEMQELVDYPPYAPPSPVLEGEAPQFRVWKKGAIRRRLLKLNCA
jgi:hypothetical protein